MGKAEDRDNVGLIAAEVLVDALDVLADKLLQQFRRGGVLEMRDVGL